MLLLDDPHWADLRGGYGLPYDPRPAIRALETNPESEAAWEDLWANLHHQGDLGEASYAAFVALVALGKRVRFQGWNFLALMATIETERCALRNPPIPAWLQGSYQQAVAELLEIALSELRGSADPLVLRYAAAVSMLARGERKLGALLAALDQSEVDDWVEQRLDWTALYDK